MTTVNQTSFTFNQGKFRIMLDFILISGICIVVVALKRWVMASEWTKEFKHNGGSDLSVFMILISLVAMLNSGCDSNKPDQSADTVKTVETVVPYEEFITKEDVENIKEDIPDSLGIVFTPGEFEGMQLFMMNCNKCHPAGKKGEGPSLVDAKVLPDYLIHFQVRTGLGDMPRFTKEELPKEDVVKIVRYVQLLREHNNYQD